MQTMRPNPVLRRFDIYVYKDKSYASPVDKAQVPATATVKLFRQGATVGAAVVVARPDFSEVTVYNPGAFATNPTPSTVFDQAWVDGDPNKSLDVDWTDSTAATTLLCRTRAPLDVITLAVSNRLVLASRRPVLYADPLGTIAIGSDIQTEAGTGRVRGYVAELRFDYTITLAEESVPRLFIDDEAAYVMRG